MSNTAREQLVEVLKHFNIQVREEDIFSRCQVCGNITSSRGECSIARRTLQL